MSRSYGPGARLTSSAAVIERRSPAQAEKTNATASSRTLLATDTMASLVLARRTLGGRTTVTRSGLGRSNGLGAVGASRPGTSWLTLSWSGRASPAAPVNT
jgi:hypothetical protein